MRSCLWGGPSDGQPVSVPDGTLVDLYVLVGDASPAPILRRPQAGRVAIYSRRRDRWEYQGEEDA